MNLYQAVRSVQELLSIKTTDIWSLKTSTAEPGLSLACETGWIAAPVFLWYSILFFIKTLLTNKSHTETRERLLVTHATAPVYIALNQLNRACNVCSWESNLWRVFLRYFTKSHIGQSQWITNVKANRNQNDWGYLTLEIYQLSSNPLESKIKQIFWRNIKK